MVVIIVKTFIAPIEGIDLEDLEEGRRIDLPWGPTVWHRREGWLLRPVLDCRGRSMSCEELRQLGYANLLGHYPMLGDFWHPDHPSAVDATFRPELIHAVGPPEPGSTYDPERAKSIVQIEEAVGQLVDATAGLARIDEIVFRRAAAAGWMVRPGDDASGMQRWVHPFTDHRQPAMFVSDLDPRLRHNSGHDLDYGLLPDDPGFSHSIDTSTKETLRNICIHLEPQMASISSGLKNAISRGRTAVNSRSGIHPREAMEDIRFHRTELTKIAPEIQAVLDLDHEWTVNLEFSGL